MKSSHTYKTKIQEHIESWIKAKGRIYDLLQQAAINLIATVLAEIVIHIIFK